MAAVESRYPMVRISGSRKQIGRELGRLAKPVMASFLSQSSTWSSLQPWRNGHPYVEELARATRQRHPLLWQELEGLAEGLEMQLDDLFLWNCRGDVLFNTQDGCTGVAMAHEDGRRIFVGHNEDGDPYLFFRGRCWVVDVQPEDDEASGFISFYYPGSLPGHTFGVNRAGIVQTINNLRCLGEKATAATGIAGVPRMVLCRAVLDCSTLDDAVGVLKAGPHAGAFHHLLASTEARALLSVEVTQGESCSVLDITGGRRRYGHANHAVHPGSEHALQQIITDSSRERQGRIDEIIERWPAGGEADGTHVIAALRDTQGELPILRSAKDDPDEENTLATGLFELNLDDASVELQIFERDRSFPVRTLTVLKKKF
eukprot:g6054.t1